MITTETEERARSLQILEKVITYKISEEGKRSRDRSEELIADFSNGFAKGWAWAVRKEFTLALDTKLTARMVKKKQAPSVVTSGALFSFAKEDTLYDTPLAYSATWEESLRHINRSIKVLSAASADEDSPGYVEAQLFEKIEGKLVAVGKIQGSQVDFVRGLIQGF